jgi:hypothetical protein
MLVIGEMKHVCMSSYSEDMDKTKVMRKNKNRKKTKEVSELLY